MNINLQNENIPIYLDVYNSLYSDIKNGVYLPNQLLPGEVQLAEKYKVSRNTLRQALAILNEDGLIIKSQGKGTIIAPLHENHTPNNVSNLLITLSKFDITSTKITYNYGSPTDIAKVKLNLSESDLVLASNCIYCVKDTVIGYSFIQIPTNFFSVLDLNTADSHSIEDTVTSTVFEYAAASSLTVKLIYANEMEIDFLQVELNTPLILMECILSDKFGSSFCRCKFYFLPEYYHLAFHLTK